MQHAWPSNRRAATFLVLFGLVGTVCVALVRADDELDQYLASMRTKMEDRAQPISERERLALEMAATLDRTAQSTNNIDTRRTRWAEAAALLDQFNAANVDHSRASEFALQSAVYLWARAQNWLERVELKPTDADAKTEGRLELDHVIRRLTRLRAASEKEPLLDRIRYRLALALRDRSQLETDDVVRRGMLERALAELPDSAQDDVLRGFSELLRAELFNDLGRFDEALKVCEKHGSPKQRPESQEMLQAKIRSLIGLKKFEQALGVVSSAKLDETSAAMTELSVRLAMRNAVPPGSAQEEAESKAVGQWRTLQKKGATAARRSTLLLAREMPKPGPGSGPDVWNGLAEGRLLRGDSDGAIRLLEEGAERAESAGHHDAAVQMRFAEGAALFQAKQFARAEDTLSRVVDDARAGEHRPKASLLRALAHRGRGSARGNDGYEQALETHIRQFPADPTSSEARWLLGQTRAETGDLAGAIKTWEDVARTSERWLDARLAIATLQQDAAEASVAMGDHSAARSEITAARATLERSLSDAGGLSQRDEIELARARLELIPEVGDAEKARAIFDRLVARPLRVESRQRLGLLKIVQLLRASRFSDADREAGSLARSSPTGMLLDLARLLDLGAATSDSNVVERRYGQVLKTVVRPVLHVPANLTANERKRAVLEMTRAIAFTGDAAAARSYLKGADIRAESLPNSLVELLGNTQARLDAHPDAIESYRVLTKRARPGSRPWLQARYEMALAYERSGQPKPAKQILDATAILHPDLGGGDLRAKYERLRTRLAR